MTPGWLTLQEYSEKYKISLSSLKKRIKNCEMDHLFKGGRYLIQDAAPVFYGEENSLRELKFLYQNLLKEKELKLKTLSEQIEDLKQLVSFLEREKLEVEGILKDTFPSLFVS